jgi:cytochrome c oxidase subunit IV
MILPLVLVTEGFLVLLGTLSVIGRFGDRERVRASLLLIILTLISAIVGPVYDMLLWTVVQCLVTIIWYPVFPSDLFVSGALQGR